MKEVTVRDSDLRRAAGEGMDAFLKVFIDGINGAVGGTLTAETMQELNADQITLLAYSMLRDEVMDGGFVQLIHNGYGGFIFLNPFAKALKQWGLRDLSRLIYDAHTLYNAHKAEIERECSDEEFMALFEQHAEFDDLDDHFVENEEEYTSAIARYVDEHIDKFATVSNE
ncbi:MAG: DMP19 family protein [Prevotella sp.]|nr:DMP19 family protein [Prevotella sp.]